MSDLRKQELTIWANAESQHHVAHEVPATALESVSGDASFRRYFRLVTDTRSFIAVDAPPANENSRLFVQVAELLRGAGVSAPEVYAVDYENGFMLLEDFGDALYLPPLLEAQAKGDNALPETLYSAAIKALVALQCGVDHSALASYDREKLHTEMKLFENWFCEAFLELSLSKNEREIIASAFQFLEDAALAQQQVAVHRDFHSRNLLILAPACFAAEASPGLIDFQDAVTGPYTYDLVSLLRDCYISWDAKLVRHWALSYLTMAKEKQLLPTISEEQFIRDFDLMGLQRHLKVMGIFSRLCIRDKKPRYLADIPLVIHYFLDVSGQYQELAIFRNWFEKTVIPVARQKLTLDF